MHTHKANLCAVAVIGAALLQTACDSSDSSSTSHTWNPPEPVDFEVVANFDLNAGTSHEGRKTDLWISYGDFRDAHHPGEVDGFEDAIAYGDFNDNGLTDVFIAPGTSQYDSVPLEFYENQGGDFALVTEQWINGEVPELPHPRKSLVADFNGDGRPDVLVVDHGPELEPDLPTYETVGHAWMLLSDSTSHETAFEVVRITERKGFYHAAAAGDLTGNGLPDLFLTTSDGGIFINLGDGNLVREPLRIRPELRFTTGAYTAEIFDVDGDGYADIVIAGHEHDGMPSQIWWGSASGVFSAERTTELPGIQGWGTVVDITLGDINGNGYTDLVLTRTGSAEETVDGDHIGRYEGYYLQVVQAQDERSYVDVTDSVLPDNHSLNSRWISWTRLQDISGNGFPDLRVDDKEFCLYWENDGHGAFEPVADACVE